jgi:GTP cyclohydrolase I
MGEACLMDEDAFDWKKQMANAIRLLLETLDDNVMYGGLPPKHTLNTPMRVVESYVELFSGCQKDPMEPLREAMFPSANYIDQMVTTKKITIYSMCAHHFLPFFGHATFSYIPNEVIVGLSKIPRSIEILCRRPQVQEYLGQQIVQNFESAVRPKGCAVLIRAYHLCNLMRGAEEHAAYTETTALRGVFKTDSGTKAEFLQTAQDTPLWGQ